MIQLLGKLMRSIVDLQQEYELEDNCSRPGKVTGCQRSGGCVIGRDHTWGHLRSIYICFTS